MRLRIFNFLIYLRYLILSIVLLQFLSACHKEDVVQYRTGDIQPPVVTGHFERNEVGEIIREVGIPNVKLGNLSNYRSSDNDYFLIVYPNPVVRASGYRLSIGVKNRSFYPVKVWITAANHPSAYMNMGTNAAVIGGAPLLTFNDISDSYTLTLESNDFETGYYRVYMQVNNVILYDNLLLIR